MKTRIFTMALTAIMLASCAEKEADLSNLQEESPVFEAVTEGFGDTKTSLDSENMVIWSKDDHLAIFQGFSIADEYQVKVSSAGKGSASFTLASDNSNMNNSAFVSGVELPSNVAYYPYVADITCAYKETVSYELGVTLPAVQNYATDTFGKDAFPMVAVTSSVADHTLRFMNVCGAIKLQLMGDVTVKSIKIKGNNGEKLSGAATVHAYLDETAPAINMAEAASDAVTLDCGNGIKLEPGSATSFIIALPPVLFSAGFSLTVTDTEGKTIVVNTARTNTVHRSSILVMQPFKLGETPKDADQENEYPVSTIKINEAGEYLVFAPGGKFTFTAAITPLDVPAEYLTWTSSDASVATIDPVTGAMTAVDGGKATITAEAGGKTATVEVECLVTTAVPVADYIDEYGVNHGKGIALMTTVWAPVNCGYNEANYPYGKLYQWGRKYGQGFLGDNGDVTTPTLVAGPMSKKTGEAEENSNVFYTVNSDPYDWCAPQVDNLWNAGTDGVPVKSQYDPCPEGWRIPTRAEAQELSARRRDNVYYGSYRKQDDSPCLILPYTGINYDDGRAYDRTTFIYWTSHASGKYATNIDWRGSGVSSGYRANGGAVRCVQE